MSWDEFLIFFLRLRAGDGGGIILAKGLDRLGFYSRFFIALLAVCIAKGAWAQCCWCDAADGCDVGKVVMGYNLVGAAICEECVSVSGSGVDCSHCNCYGYDDNCPFGNPDGKKCKKLEKCPSPCEYYKLCDIATGNITATQIVGACHMEGETCYSNTRDCKDFPISADFGPWSCTKPAQTGPAQWNDTQNAWDTYNCACQVVNKDIDMYVADGVKCKKANAVYHVTDEDRYKTKKIDEQVHYSLERSWCAKCYPGYLPSLVTAQSDDGIWARPDNNGNWGVVACPGQVTKPDYYAPGCTIDFNKDTDVVMASCRKECPTGFVTEIDGATQIGQCKSDGGTTYEDGTGYFIIPELASCD